VSKMAEALELERRLKQSVKAHTAPPPNVLTPGEEGPRLPEFQAAESIIDPEKVARNIVCITDAYSPAAEQYRKLRGQLCLSTHRSTLMVTSADVGEGKSVTAVNFAIALAREIDHTVLLVDADLRNPSIHTYLGIKADFGLSEYLEGRVKNLSDVLIKTGIGRLVLLPAGAPPPNSDELLSSNRMKELAQEMKNRYADRYIIYDSSPILACADAASLSKHVDGILLVIQAERTSQKTAKEALALLHSTPVLGVVYNNVPDYMCKNIYPYDYYRYNQCGGSAKSESDRGKS
jgi:protein-tyrosine kinase